jgi:flagellar biosynthesis GTPase FlhF
MTEKMAETDAKIAESNAKYDAKKAETDAQIAESNKKIAESDAKIAESNKKTDERFTKTEKLISEMFQEMKETHKLTERKIKETHELTERKMNESHEKTEQAIRDFVVESNKILDRLSDNIGNVGNRLGDIVELIVIPGVRKEINALGHKFKRSYPNKKINGRKERIAEIDLLLTDGTEAMAVEIKSNLSANYVDAFLMKLKKLRKFETEANLQGKKLYGAMVGVYVDERARKLALKNGLYVIEILEEEKKLKTDKPTKCRAW